TLPTCPKALNTTVPDSLGLRRYSPPIGPLLPPATNSTRSARAWGASHCPTRAHSVGAADYLSSTRRFAERAPSALASRSAPPSSGARRPSAAAATMVRQAWSAGSDGESWRTTPARSVALPPADDQPAPNESNSLHPQDPDPQCVSKTGSFPGFAPETRLRESRLYAAEPLIVAAPRRST